MISVLTLTYQRHHLLEEAIYSYLSQDWEGESEMVIINDSPLVQYKIENPKIRIINCDTRFNSIGKKLEFGFSQCNGEYIYRLDDDDLMTPWALSLHAEYRKQNPDCEIYRCQKHYFYSHNEFQGLSDSINNGNCYSKSYIDRISIPDSSMGEDNNITFFNNAKIHIGDLNKYSMIYRWGMGTYHVSGMGHDKNNSYVQAKVDAHIEHVEGIVTLEPNFKENYYNKLP
jgi:hypothetical protein